MRVSKRTEYGLRAAVALARQMPKRYIQAKDLAAQEKLPTKFLEAILLTLRRGGFLESKIGRDGGYRLSRAPDAISVGDLTKELEGRLQDRDPAESRHRAAGEAVVQYINEELTRVTDEVLDRLSLADLVVVADQAAEQLQQMYYI